MSYLKTGKIKCWSVSCKKLKADLTKKFFFRIFYYLLKFTYIVLLPVLKQIIFQSTDLIHVCIIYKNFDCEVKLFLAGHLWCSAEKLILTVFPDFFKINHTKQKYLSTNSEKKIKIKKFLEKYFLSCHVSKGLELYQLCL